MIGLTYPPLNRLKQVCDGLWVVDGPVIRYGMPWPKLPFSTRMTLVRIGDHDLFVHSPTPPEPELLQQIEAIGRPRWIIGPNRIHYWWIPDWKRAFPQADVYLAPGIEGQADGRIDFPSRPLAGSQGYPWDEQIATLPVAGSFMTEVVFFDRATRTLILTDLIENFEADKLGSRWMRWLTKVGGVQHPRGSMPRDMRLTFRGQRAQLRAAVEKMIGWNPERVILAHGRWYESQGADELRRAFRWLLE